MNRRRFKRQMRHHRPSHEATIAAVDHILREWAWGDLTDLIWRPSPILERLEQR